MGPNLKIITLVVGGEAREQGGVPPYGLSPEGTREPWKDFWKGGRGTMDGFAYLKGMLCLQCGEGMKARWKQ